MNSLKQNCWDYMQCGHTCDPLEKDSSQTCPAVTATELNGINSGVNGGRMCWGIAGTFCGDQVLSKHAAVIDSCYHCEFFQLVKSQEEPDEFIFTLPGWVFL